ncbi:MAG: pitrilysin family protein [Bacteroidota bacterium]|nr:pitrilysin family protein [Bacteroidota bacterium]
MSLERNIAPQFHKVKDLHFPEYQKIEIKTGIDLYAIKAGTEPVIRLDLVFNAGLTRQLKKAESSFTAQMLSEGTSKKTASALADALDFYGAYFQTRSNADDAIASLYCLEKHLKSCLPIFIEALVDSIFPPKELDIIRKNSIQKLLVNEKKNNYLCRKVFYQKLLGAHHPYAGFSEKADLENLNLDDLKSFYKTNYLSGLKFLILSGNFSEITLGYIHESIKTCLLQNSIEPRGGAAISTILGKHFVEKNDSVQSAIRIGKLSIERAHPDYRKLQLLNLIFGGYFGSRLMKNIREDKGLTYGIYSVLESFQQTSVWYIETEINTKNREQGLTEIYKELAAIRNEPIGAHELEVAKNYMLGSFLRSLDGPFSLADRLKIIIDFGLSKDYYAEFVHIINSMSPEALMAISNKYFSAENIVEVLVGKK